MVQKRWCGRGKRSRWKISVSESLQQKEQKDSMVNDKGCDVKITFFKKLVILRTLKSYYVLEEQIKELLKWLLLIIGKTYLMY